MAFKTLLINPKCSGKEKKVIVILTGITVCTLVSSSDSTTNELPHTITWLIYIHKQTHTHTIYGIYIYIYIIISEME